MRRNAPWLVLLVVVMLGASGCSEGDSDEPVNLAAACSNPVAGSGPRVYTACGTVSGSMVSVDVYGTEVSDEVDGYSLRISFSPTSFRYVGFALDQNLFGSACGQGTVCQDNGSNANTTGEVVLGIDLANSLLPGVVIGNSQRLLARLTFEAGAVATTTLALDLAAVPGCVGSSTSGNALHSFDNSCLQGVSVISGVTFSGGVTLSATAY